MPVPPPTREIIAQAIDMQSQASRALLEEILEQKNFQRAGIQIDIDEFFFIPSGTLVQVNPQTRNQVRITSCLIVCTSAATLVLGIRKIPLTAGTYQWGGLKWILNADDVRTLTQTTPGLMGLELMGESLVNTGII